MLIIDFLKPNSYVEIILPNTKINCQSQTQQNATLYKIGYYIELHFRSIYCKYVLYTH